MGESQLSLKKTQQDSSQHAFSSCREKLRNVIPLQNKLEDKEKDPEFIIFKPISYF